MSVGLPSVQAKEQGPDEAITGRSLETSIKRWRVSVEYTKIDSFRLGIPFL